MRTVGDNDEGESEDGTSVDGVVVGVVVVGILEGRVVDFEGLFDLRGGVVGRLLGEAVGR